MAQPFIGEIRIFAGNFAPKGWAYCAGQLLPISQNQALFALVGTTYGGNGTTTFALPDLRGRAMMGLGAGPGLSPRVQGQVGGVPTVTLSANQLPAHAHAVQVSAEAPSVGAPTDAVIAAPADTLYTDAATVPATFAGDLVAIVGGGAPHENRQPFLGVSAIVAVEGIFPSQS